MADRPKSKVREEKFKGNPVLILPLPPGRDGKEYDFSFGVQKARVILEYIEEIRDFVLSHEHGGGGKAPSPKSRSPKRDESEPSW